MLKIMNMLGAYRPAQTVKRKIIMAIAGLGIAGVIGLGWYMYSRTVSVSQHAGSKANISKQKIEECRNSFGFIQPLKVKLYDVDIKVDSKATTHGKKFSYKLKGNPKSTFVLTSLVIDKNSVGKYLQLSSTNTEKFALVMQGKLNVPKSAKYQFWVTNLNDGIKIEIDGKKVFEKMYVVSTKTSATFNVTLNKGEHTVKIVFVNAGGDYSASVSAGRFVQEPMNPRMKMPQRVSGNYIDPKTGKPIAHIDDGARMPTVVVKPVVIRYIPACASLFNVVTPTPRVSRPGGIIEPTKPHISQPVITRHPTITPSKPHISQPIITVRPTKPHISQPVVTVTPTKVIATRPVITNPIAKDPFRNVIPSNVTPTPTRPLVTKPIVSEPFVTVRPTKPHISRPIVSEPPIITPSKPRISQPVITVSPTKPRISQPAIEPGEKGQQITDPATLAYLKNRVAEYLISIGAINTSSDVVRISAREITFNDSCLGFRQANEMCAQVMTPGYSITVQTRSSGTLTVHANKQFSIVKAMYPDGRMFDQRTTSQGVKNGNQGQNTGREIPNNYEPDYQTISSGSSTSTSSGNIFESIANWIVGLFFRE